MERRGARLVSMRLGLGLALLAASVGLEARAQPVLLETPEGWIAFESRRSGTLQLYFRPADPSGNAAVITTAGGRDAVWTESGKALYFTSSRNGGPAIYTVRPEDSGSRPSLVVAGSDPSVDTLETALVFVSTGRLFRRSPGGQVTQISPSDVTDRSPSVRKGLAPFGGVAGDPDPWIVFVRQESPEDGDLWVSDLYGNATRIVDTPYLDDSPDYSKPVFGGHRRIAFACDRRPEGAGTPRLDICVVDPDGSNEMNLTSDVANDYSPAWSPDGKFIVFASDRDGQEVTELDLYLIELASRTIVRLTNEGGYAPTWRR